MAIYECLAYGVVYFLDPLYHQTKNKHLVLIGPFCIATGMLGRIRVNQT